MNKKKVLTIVGILAVVGIGGYFVWKSSKKNSSDLGEQDLDNSEAGISGQFEGQYIWAKGNGHTWLVKNGKRVRWDKTGITSTEVNKIRKEVSLAQLEAIGEA